LKESSDDAETRSGSSRYMIVTDLWSSGGESMTSKVRLYVGNKAGETNYRKEVNDWIGGKK